MQLVSDVIDIDEYNFVCQVISYTLPYMILMRKHDVIEKMQNIMRHTPKHETLAKTCTNYFPEILGILLVQEHMESETSIMRLLTDVCVDLRKTDLPSIVRSDPVEITAAILKSCTEENEARRERVCPIAFYYPLA